MPIHDVLIIEDEAVAAHSLEKLLAQVNPAVRVVAFLQGVEDTVEWFQSHAAPDLIFVDIHLADGSAFHIFEQVAITCPVVFTTAYDQYALEAFKVNSIDYLLKPISLDALRQAFAKLDNLRDADKAANGILINDQIDRLVTSFRTRQHYQSAFLIPLRDKLLPVNVDDIACFYIDTKSTHLLTLSGVRYAIDGPLDALMDKLNPALFFRANRQFIVSRKAVKDISVFFGGKLSVGLTVPLGDNIIVSKGNTAAFKAWFTEGI